MGVSGRNGKKMGERRQRTMTGTDHRYQGHSRSAPAMRRPYDDKDEQIGRGCKSLTVVVVVAGGMLAGPRTGGGKSEREN